MRCERARRVLPSVLWHPEGVLATPVRAAFAVATLPVRVLRALLSAPDKTSAPHPADPSPAPVPASGTRVGKYDLALLQLATEQPGITVATAAAEIEVPASGLYPTIRRLEGQGRLEKRGRGLHST